MKAVDGVVIVLEPERSSGDSASRRSKFQLPRHCVADLVGQAQRVIFGCPRTRKAQQ